MTIQEVTRAGKPFRRPTFPEDCWYVFPSTELVLSSAEGSPRFTHTLDLDDLLADDWVVKELHASVTRADLLTAYRKAVKESYGHADKFFYLLCEELGL